MIEELLIKRYSYEDEDDISGCGSEWDPLDGPDW